ncbi:MAG TPA: ATP-binding cassette domain-containing protein [Candidatus Sulfotelmatobacter sp.]|nr:ATP-binding cassette domain-containing protein [Candidatus Sulfotelmatobacter sp.]
MLRANAISKRFGRTLALDGVDFEARPGEIHALLGENGAGKTTLMNVLAGSLAPDSGEALLDDAPLQAGSPRAALAAGIAAVHQSPMLFERMTWEENLALGGFDQAAERLDLEAVASRARALATKLGFELPPAGTTVENRSVAERVRLEVLRALSFNPRVLILDEPTSVLAPSELNAFLDLLRNLRAEGRIVVLITHKLAEAIAVADRITVLRRGRVVARTTPAETSEEQLAELMIGEIVIQPDAGAARRPPGEPVLQIENLTLDDYSGRRILDGISLRVGAGEIVGIAGVDGNGQTELVEVLAGVRDPSSGKATSNGAMAVIPQNRDLDGLILDMRLWENMILARPLREQATSYGWLNATRAIDLCRELIERFRIQAPGPETLAGALSGGNRQRLEVARAVASQPRVIVAHNICRGLDLAATAEVHRTMLDFAAAGGAVLLISSDLDELLAICGRLLIISRGKIRETSPGERDPGRLGLLMAGARD